MTSAAERLRPPAGWDRPPMGELALRVGVRGGRSVAVDQFHRGALRVVKPHYLDGSGQVCYALINPGGGYLGGDDYLTEIDVEEGASLLLTTQAATKVYKTPTLPARQHSRIRLGAGAMLESLPEQVIVYREGTYEQSADVEVHPEATYIAAEVVTPGWAPDGTRFGYRRVNLRTEVFRPGDDVPYLVDALVLEPGADDVPGLGGLDGFSHVGSLLVVDPRVADGLVTEVFDVASAGDVRVGVSLAPGPALVLRALGSDTASVTACLHRIDALVRARWFDQAPVDLRKY